MPNTSRTTAKAVDAGQNNHTNESSTNGIQDMEKEKEERTTNETINPYDPVSEEGVLGLLAEIEYDRDETVYDEKLVATSLFHIYTLVSRWIENKVIEGVFSVGESHLEEDMENYLNWAYYPRVVYRKQKSIVEYSFEVKTTINTYQLYQDQQSLCQSSKIKISTKKTEMGQYIQRIGFLTGPHVRLASSDHYVKEINNKALIHRGCIEIKKQSTHEKGSLTKALVVYAVTDEAKSIDEKIFNTVFKRFRYISYKVSDSAQRLAAMYNNEFINVKSHFETLYNVSLNDTVFKGIDQVTLEDVLLKEKYGIHNLFLAVEQGSSQYSKHTNVVLNPQVKDQARRWLVDEYPLLMFLETISQGTSVIAPPNANKEKYDKDLKEFLAPNLSTKEAKQTKKYGKKLKSYAEVLGIEIHQPKEMTKEKKKEKSILLSR